MQLLLSCATVVTGLEQKIVTTEVDGCDFSSSDCFWKTSATRTDKTWRDIQCFLLDLT